MMTPGKKPNFTGKHYRPGADLTGVPGCGSGLRNQADCISD